MRQQQLKLSHVFLIAAPLFLGACGTIVKRTDIANCNSQDVSTLNIPLLTESSITSNAVSDGACKTGAKLAAVALIGRHADGTLHPASIIGWYRNYQELIAKMTAPKGDTPEEQAEAKELARTKNFADQYIEIESTKLGQGLVTSPIVIKLYEMKITDPSIFTPDGNLLKKSFCKGMGIFRVCTKPEEEIAKPAADGAATPTAPAP